MASLGSPLARPPAEDLQHSQVKKSTSAQRAKQRGFSTWFLGSWNVRSLLDSEGPIETARARSEASLFIEDRRIDQVLQQLNRYNIYVAALQETKWFGNAVYSVGESTVLASGRPTPLSVEPRLRGEGVAIVLSGPAVRAWKAAGQQWKAWSSRVISAVLQPGKTNSSRIHFLSCYAPTFSASRDMKNQFLDDLQRAMDAVPSNECYVIMGDFNARVGSNPNASGQRADVYGPHGTGVINEAGEELLAFLATNEARVCNTWFPKKEIHKRTWQHPKSKKWHCIDYAVIRQRDHKRCLDACVKRGAECNTDHQLLRIKLRVRGKGGYHRSSPKKKNSKFDVGHLTGTSETCAARRDQYVEEVASKTLTAWTEGGTVEEKWGVIRSAMVESARDVLGFEGRRHQPDWFRESEGSLEPLFQKRSSLYSKWLNTGQKADLLKFKEARRVTRKAMRQAKDAWFRKKAEKAELHRFGGKDVWRSIRDMQQACRGLIPQKTGNIKDEHGCPCTTVEEKQQRWRRHFTGILNVRSRFNQTELDKIKQRPLRTHLADLPSLDELETAVGKIKNGKAGGSSGILPEMVKIACLDTDLLERLLALTHTVWKEKSAPKEWTDAILIPIPKKGDLSNCDNWRGISLLDVVGKVIARIIQDRLQLLAEEELPESQCGFRKGRSCTDMIFTVRQLVEKSWEHQAKIFLLFIDLKKAYDSVPREALWLALAKLGVPESIIQLIKSFHQGMEATIQLDGSTLDPIAVDNGLRQGCCMAPVLFNIYAGLLVERWKDRVAGKSGVGVNLNYKHDRKLFRRYTRNANQINLTELQFADDAALLASTREGAEEVARTYMEVASDLGLTVSVPKTKLMVTGRRATLEDKILIPVGASQIDCVDEFLYLGSVISSSGRMRPDVDRRIAQASKAFGALRKPVFNNRDLSLKTKHKVYQACVLSVLLYGSECWSPLRSDLKRLDSFHNRCLRNILGISRQQQRSQRITSGSVRRRWRDTDTLTDKIFKRRAEWLGHLARMPDNRIPKISLCSWLPQPCPRGGPRKRWKDVIRKDLQRMKVSEDEWYEAATSSRAAWRGTYKQGSPVNAPSVENQDFTQENSVQCTVCIRTFRREGDKKRHKCLSERSKPIAQQQGATRCPTCSRWFRSRGGLAVHNCRPENP